MAMAMAMAMDLSGSVVHTTAMETGPRHTIIYLTDRPHRQRTAGEPGGILVEIAMVLDGPGQDVVHSTQR